MPRTRQPKLDAAGNPIPPTPRGPRGPRKPKDAPAEPNQLWVCTNPHCRHYCYCGGSKLIPPNLAGDGQIDMLMTWDGQVPERGCPKCAWVMFPVPGLSKPAMFLMHWMTKAQGNLLDQQTRPVQMQLPTPLPPILPEVQK